MKSLEILFKFKNFIILFLVLMLNTQVLSIETKIVVKVDNKIVTNIDIINEIKYLTVLNPNLGELDRERIFQIAKASLVREKIKEIEISKYENASVEPDYIENIIKNIYKQIGLNNKNEFINYIKNYGIELKTVEKKLSDEAIWNSLIYNKFISKVKIDKNKIKEDIKKTEKKFNSYLLYEIIFNVDENVKLNDLFDKIKLSINENGFENTASIFSISDSAKTGGNLGWINEGTIDKKILNYIYKLKKGEYTDPILIPGGFIILLLKDKKKLKQEIDLNTELSARIRNTQNQQLNQFSNIYFNKIKKDINIYEN